MAIGTLFTLFVLPMFYTYIARRDVEATSAATFQEGAEAAGRVAGAVRSPSGGGDRLRGARAPAEEMRLDRFQMPPHAAAAPARSRSSIASTIAACSAKL